jgi:hypothetical protein
MTKLNKQAGYCGAAQPRSRRAPALPAPLDDADPLPDGPDRQRLGRWTPGFFARLPPLDSPCRSFDEAVYRAAPMAGSWR